jgi:Uri superfamily endonuclease
LLTPPATTYQLTIHVPARLRLRVGRLGLFDFPPGNYVYTGSARRNIEARVARHRRKEKTLRWHIDYLLAAPGVEVVATRLATHAECALNQATPGRVVVPGFGASDCRAGCGSHLKWLGAG